MATPWTLTATEVCTDALEHLGVLGEGEAASGDQIQTALRGLDVVLKELPLRGYTWPKLSGEVAVTWAAGAAVALPSDYFGYPVAWKLVGTTRYPLVQITHGEWAAMLNREATGTISKFYITPAKTFVGWPVQATDPTVTIQYQRIADDAALATAPDLPQYWLGALGYGVAHELALKFGVPPDKRQEIEARWMAKRELALLNSVQSEPVSFGVAD